MVFVPAGMFWMGCNEAVDQECENDESPYHEVYLDAFCIDRHEVTVDEYETCVEKKKCIRTVMGGECNFARKERRGHPANCVNQKKAEMFCEWKGKRLPTEAEWEKAARGIDGRIYPWGNEPASCEFAVMPDGEKKGCGKGGSWPVGSKPKDTSPYGVMDMSGNVSEWVSDLYEPSYYRRSPKKNPRGPERGSVNIFRGGGWSSGNSKTTRASKRSQTLRIIWFSELGFRCAKDAP